MARRARLKPADRGVYYHLTNRIAGMEGDYPFGDAEKQKFIDLLKNLSSFFTIEILSYQVMGNHWHIICYAPAGILSPAKAAERYNRHYEGKKAPLSPDDPQCGAVALQMRDISCLVGWLQQQFSTWYNKTRTRRRRGTLWADRFKSVILERATALWHCMCYVEMNPVRAHLVEDPAQYPFGTWGEWCAVGKHPFGSNLATHLPAYEGKYTVSRTLPEIGQRFRAAFKRLMTEDPAHVQWREPREAGPGTKCRSPHLAPTGTPRVRQWSDGLIVGRESFVRKTARQLKHDMKASEHRLDRAHGASLEGLCSYRRLRTIEI